jgi:hypothetical protein
MAISAPADPHALEQPYSNPVQTWKAQSILSFEPQRTDKKHDKLKPDYPNLSLDPANRSLEMNTSARPSPGRCKNQEDLSV